MVGFIISFGIRCNVGVATVSMMSNKTNDEGDVTEISEFHWSPETIGYVDSSFFWGYIITQLPGGFLASRFPANRLFGTAIFLSSCLNLLIPAATILDSKAVIVVRVMQVLVILLQGDQLNIAVFSGTLTGYFLTRNQKNTAMFV